MRIIKKVKRIELDGDYQGGWVDIRVNPPAGEMLDAIGQLQTANKEQVTEVIPAVYDMFKISLVAWNFTDENDIDIPCTEEGIKSLPLNLLTMLASKIIEVTTDSPLASKSNLSEP